jgi:hypothetical protein
MENYHFEDVEIDGEDYMNRIYLAQDRDRWRTVMKRLWTFEFLLRCNFLTTCMIYSFSRRILLESVLYTCKISIT